MTTAASDKVRKSESTLNVIYEIFETNKQGKYPENGYSVQEVADLLKVSYYTVRMYVVDLVNAGRLEKSPHRQGRTQFFRIPDDSSTPKFHFNPKPGTAKISMLDAARTFGQPGSFAFLNELPTFPLILAEFYSIAARVGDGAKMTNSDVVNLKANLHRLKLYSQNLSGIISEMLSTPSLWDVHSMAEALLLDPVAPVTTDEAREIANNIKSAFGGGTAVDLAE